MACLPASQTRCVPSARTLWPLGAPVSAQVELWPSGVTLAVREVQGAAVVDDHPLGIVPRADDFHGLDGVGLGEVRRDRRGGDEHRQGRERGAERHWGASTWVR